MSSPDYQVRALILLVLCVATAQAEEVFESADAAACAGMGQLLLRANQHEVPVEYSVLIYQQGASYGFTEPLTSGQRSHVRVAHKVPRGAVPVGWAHNHHTPREDRFTRTDVLTTRQLGLSGYLVVPGQEVSYLKIVPARASGPRERRVRTERLACAS